MPKKVTWNTNLECNFTLFLKVIGPGSTLQVSGSRSPRSRESRGDSMLSDGDFSLSSGRLDFFNLKVITENPEKNGWVPDKVQICLLKRKGSKDYS